MKDMTELHITDVIRQTKGLNTQKDKLQVNSKKSFLNVNQQSKEIQKYHRRDAKPNL
jgi:hypothetical protein